MAMKTKPLFPTDNSPSPPEIPGLRYVPEYLSPAEEADLRRAIDLAPWDTSWDRCRQPYGGAYGTKSAPAPPIPDWGRQLADRIFADPRFRDDHAHGPGAVDRTPDRTPDRPFDQMLINEYLPGQGIALHRDYEPYDRTVVSVSLLAGCLMDFRRVVDGRREALWLEPRSLLVLRDEARYEWEHGIARRKSDLVNGARTPRARRLSITFRTVKVG
jgi:alkylated DNA repair dioxygenase AlkB